jgi:post-segregation antitoxin (ccd killing protein)
VASALYLSARSVDGEILKRAREYRVDVLAAAEVAGLVAWIRRWQAGGA